MIVKTNAIVLRSRNLRETSKFISLYTEAFGKLTVVAKGVRQQKSKLSGVLEPFNIISVVLYKKENRDVHYISNAEIVEPMWKLTTNYDALATAFAIAELTDVTMHGEEKNQGLFALLADTLRMLASGKLPNRFVLLQFQIRLITLLGYGLDIRHCAQCARDIIGAEHPVFHIPEGGFLCPDCSKSANSGTKISPSAYKFLFTVIEGQGSADNQNIAGERAECAELTSLLNAYIIYHSESKQVLHAVSLMGSKI